VLIHAYPRADVPVVQLSIDHTQPPSFHYEMGRRLAELRDEGVMIAGSGDVVHNLAAARREDGAPPYDWAVRFNDLVKRAIKARDHEQLIRIDEVGEDAALSIPTDEHWLPLMYVLGAMGQDEPVTFFNDAVELGSISMLGFTAGGEARGP
jgi:4,5-DOPA dioxygenase extradiol